VNVFINDLQDKYEIDASLLQHTALTILHEMDCDERCELSVALVDDQEMHRLNLQYRGIDRTTDVLSFALQEAEEPLVVTELGHQAYPLILGDVILSTETTQKQAEEHRHSFEKELDVLLIHGILHLLGYDHQIDEEALIMEELERKITNTLAIDRR
jgi:probable rRNA maturation factor